jgi:hypothetical protein
MSKSKSRKTTDEATANRSVRGVLMVGSEAGGLLEWF